MYKALIVDDELMIRRGIQQTIHWDDVGIDEVFQAGGGEEALSIIKKELPDLMITDINMTGMNGLELIEETKKICPDMKVLVLTGYDDFNYAQQSLRLQVSDFFLKPIDEEVLEMAINEVIQQKKEEVQETWSNNRNLRALSIKEQLYIEDLMRHLISKIQVTQSVNELVDHFNYDKQQAVIIAHIIPNLKIKDKDSAYSNLFMKNVCIDLFDSKDLGITFNDTDGRLLIAIFVDEDNDDTKDKLEALSSILEDEYNSKIKIIVGSIVSEFADIYISYNDALLLAKHEKEEVQGIIQHHNIEKRRQLFEDVFSELKGYMIVNIGNTDIIFKAFDTLLKAMDAYNISVLQVRRCCFDIGAELYYAYITDTGNAVDDKLTRLLEALNLANKQMACDTTKKFIRGLFDNDDHQQDELIYAAKKIIADNLNGELSVGKLAETLFVTPNYLSRLFKKVVGIGCNEYIIMKRIEKAKALLETTSMKSGNIARFVGYNDTNYFSLAFKKHTGLSPTAYREKIRGEQF